MMTTEFHQLALDTGQDARSIELVREADFAVWEESLPPRAKAAVLAARFRAKPGTLAILPGTDAQQWAVAYGVSGRELATFDLAAAAEKLPQGTYRLAGNVDPGRAAVGWLLAHYSFQRYRKVAEPVPDRVLLVPPGTEIDARRGEAEAQAMVRDLVNTPAEDMGPADVEAAARRLAARHGAELEAIVGEALRTANFPTILAVGRAAAPGREPRLVRMTWGQKGNPGVVLVGKGVCFDSGGLDIKPSAGMRLMKKDMGGAAHALALAGLVMQARLPVRLTLLIPAVENAIDGNAIRPGDVVVTRKGISVEIDNTDAEGRLVLCDALAHASESKPDLIMDFATLTGAARVALGPDLPAMFANDNTVAAGLVAAGQAVDDPVWHMPLWRPYLDMLKSDVADIANSTSNGFAGAILAALYLAKFVEDDIAWAHFDTFAWVPTGKPGRPKGGEALGMRAAFRFLQDRYGVRRAD